MCGGDFYAGNQESICYFVRSSLGCAGRFAGVAGKCTRSLDFRECFIKSRTAYLR